ncbi:DUF2796 domain-containing protein [Halopseudomonas salegens]|uniref:DUF2796 domain-containing protein n=1 Tax=Halopseudomonas salegens TaxID=1434072 RepID=A0A1H2EH24_9GAMM|nr:DUF2796 domain-containing protein [Halopseudomonas salegens]SDT94436.1 Protein of unknown function [Halopseudomonas salegens]
MRVLPLIAGGLLTSLAFALHAHSDHGHGHTEHDHDKHQHDHGDSLAAHAHGVAHLNLVLQGAELAVELDSPADNILGFEYLPTSNADKATAKAAMDTLRQADAIISLPSTADCALDDVTLKSPIFAALEQEHHHGHDHDHQHEDGKSAHNDISAQYQFTCSNPDALSAVEVSLFEHFPRTETVILQAITPGGQQGGELSAGNNSIRF